MKFRLSRTSPRAIAVVAGTIVAALAITSAAFAATASPGSAAARAASAAIPKCTAALGQTGNVSAWVAADQGNGAAGTIYYPLEFTNLSGRTCSMRGFPGVSAIGRNGRQPAARRTGSQEAASERRAPSTSPRARPSTRYSPTTTR